MTAPDFIWAYNERQRGYSFTAKGPQPHFEGVEFVRRDPSVLAALPEVQAMKAAAVECAAGAMLFVTYERALFGDDGVTRLISAGKAADAIRALIPSDAMSALAAYRDREVAKALEGAAAVAEAYVRRAMHLSTDGYEIERLHGHMAQKAAADIRALIPQVKP